MHEYLRQTVRGLLAAGCLAVALPAPATIDLTTPDGQLTALRRIQCSDKDGKAITFYWNGFVYSRVPGEADRLLFRVEGMNTRQCGPLANAKSPAEFRLVSREVLLYEDPVTGEVLRTWTNPWTGKSVEVMHVANDPVNGNYTGVGRDGKPLNIPYAVQGDRWWSTLTVPLFYPNPLGGAYQQYVGGTYHVTEMFNNFGSLADLNNRKRDTAEVSVGWERLSPWLPWMEMGDRAGEIYFHTAGRKLDRWDDLPASMQSEIRKNYPEYNVPPPLDDARPNETSWTYFKKLLDRKKAN